MASSSNQLPPKVLILGDTTVQNGIPRVRMELILGQTSQFVHCTKFTSLTEEICKVQSHVKVLVISCLSGIIGSMGSVNDSKNALERTMTMLGSALYDVVRHRQGSIRIFVAPPTPRPALDFKSNVKYSMRCLADCVKDVKAITILYWGTEYDVRQDSSLSDASCKQFLEDLLMAVRKGLERGRTSSTSSSSSQTQGQSQSAVKPAGTSTPLKHCERTPSMDDDMRMILEEEDDLTVVENEVFQSANSLPPGDYVTSEGLIKRLKKLEANLMEKLREVQRQVDENGNEVREFIETYESRRELDIYAFADQSERSDYASNLLKTNCVLLTGLRTDDYPKESSEQNAKVVEIVRGMVQKVLGREETFSLTVRKSAQRRYAKETSQVLIPPIEVKMSLVAAQEFRMKGAALARAKTEGFQGIFFGQCTTLSTRIRCEILRSLSKVLNSQDSSMEVFCIGNTSRPLLSYGPRGTKGGRRTYLYVEALKEFKQAAREMDLSEAYKRARPIYNGRLEHTFVVLKEGDDEAKVTGANQEPIGSKKRGPEDDERGESKRQAK